MITTFDPVAGVASAQGLDVSNFQGQFDWAHAKATIPDLAFGIFRLTEGLPSSGDNSPDPDAVWNHNQIRAQGLYRGAYHFLHPSLSGKAQAAYFVQAHQQIGFEQTDMLWLDNEVTDGLGPAQVAACARDFMTELKVLRPNSPQGVYTFISFASGGYNAGLGSLPLWLAFPNATAPTAPPPWAKWTFWQWGARNGTDADAFQGTTSALHNWIASFSAAPAQNGFPHFADGATDWGTYAAQRGFQDPLRFLEEQFKLHPQDAANLLFDMVPKAGARYWTENP